MFIRTRNMRKSAFSKYTAKVFIISKFSKDYRTPECSYFQEISIVITEYVKFSLLPDRYIAMNGSRVSGVGGIAERSTRELWSCSALLSPKSVRSEPIRILSAVWFERSAF